MKIGKPKSKRVPVRLRHKIEKSSLSKQRKERKQAKKNPQWVSRIKKDPGIPNMYPYKDKILAEIEEARSRKAEEAQRRKDIAKAQRQGTVVEDAKAEIEVDDEDEELLDIDEDEDEEMAVSSNPMAALLASAQARASAYSKDDGTNNDDDDTENEWHDASDTIPSTNLTQPTRKALPAQALADPVKAVSAVMERMQQTQDGIQQLIDHYHIPALATGNAELSSRFLVEVARKRGRLGRGGIPNMHAAALIVLSDLNEDRLRLPAPPVVKTPRGSTAAATGLGKVQVVATMAQPFKLDGLWGEEKPAQQNAGMDMIVES